MKKLFCFHIWFVTKTLVDPMEKGVCFSNYVNIIYDCKCLKCGKATQIKKTQFVSAESEDTRRREYLESVAGKRDLERARLMQNAISFSDIKKPI